MDLFLVYSCGIVALLIPTLMLLFVNVRRSDKLLIEARIISTIKMGFKVQALDHEIEIYAIEGGEYVIDYLDRYHISRFEVFEDPAIATERFLVLKRSLE